MNHPHEPKPLVPPMAAANRADGVIRAIRKTYAAIAFAERQPGTMPVQVPDEGGL